MIAQSGLLERLKAEFDNATIILFGSYARGEDKEDSDIDLYVQTPAKKTIRLESFEKYLGRNIQLFIHKDIHEVSKDLANNILNGIVLNGSIEVFR
jgi:predicted nucleotidyltransferase